MTQWKLVDSAQIPGDGGVLQLHQHKDEFTITIEGGGLLMDTCAHDSEDVLAKLACKKIADRPKPRILIGGLGMGFTLAAAQSHLGADAEIVVAELIPAVIEWNRGPLGEHAGHPLRDERTTVRQGDVVKILKAERHSFDAVLLDVDNGPEGFTRKKNEWLYTIEGLSTAYAALRPLGILAVWSAGPDRSFTERLKKAGFRVTQARVRAHDNKGDLHTIWFAECGP
jgi:spermidine synthase